MKANIIILFRSASEVFANPLWHTSSSLLSGCMLRNFAWNLKLEAWLSSSAYAASVLTLAGQAIMIWYLIQLRRHCRGQGFDDRWPAPNEPDDRTSSFASSLSLSPLSTNPNQLIMPSSTVIALNTAWAALHTLQYGFGISAFNGIQDVVTCPSTNRVLGHKGDYSWLTDCVPLTVSLIFEI
jgi:threonine/homoserine/homoserine lactone efflux protein